MKQAIQKQVVVKPKTARPYQQSVIDSANHAMFIKELAAVMIQSGTGSGKTVIMSKLILDHCELMQKKGIKAKVLVLAHRSEIIDQIADTLLSEGVACGRVQSGVTNLDTMVQVGSVDTYVNRVYTDDTFYTKKNKHKAKVDLFSGKKADKENIDRQVKTQWTLIVIDEAHHSRSNSYQKIIKAHKEHGCKILGLTATPYRLEGLGFTDLYDTLVCGKSVYWLEKHNHLCPSLLHIPDIDKSAFDRINAKMKGMRDYDKEELSELMDNGEVTADIVQSYIEYANNKQAICFAVDVKHSKHIVEKFLSKGISAVHVDGSMDKDVRRKIFDDFSKRNYQVVVNVGIVSEGTDLPICECVILARPTKSLSLYLQMCGRGSRPNPDTGKTHYILIDLANCYEEHGLPNAEHDWYEYFEGMGKKKGKKPFMEGIKIKEDDLTLILTKEQFEKKYPNGIEGVGLIVVNGIFRIDIFNRELLLGKKHNISNYKIYANFCEVLKADNSYPNLEELKAIAKKLGYSKQWVDLQHADWLKYAEKHSKNKQNS